MSSKFDQCQKVLCAGTLQNADFETRVSVAAESGFEAITLFPEQYLAIKQREKLSYSVIQNILKNYGIRVLTIDPLLDWFGEQPSKQEVLLLEIAGETGAEFINIAPAFAPELSEQQLVDALSRLAERAQKQGIKIEVEPLPWSIIPDYRKMFRLLELCRQPNLYITFDCLHFYRSGGTVSDLQSLTSEQLKRVSEIQLCDVPDQPKKLKGLDKLSAAKTLLASGLNSQKSMGWLTMMKLNRYAYTGRKDAQTLMSEAICNRLLPGEGNIPLKEIIAVFETKQCQPALSIETFSLALNQLPAETIARQSMQALRNITVKEYQNDNKNITAEAIC